MWQVFIWVGIWPNCGNESWSAVTHGEFLDWLSNYELLGKGTMDSVESMDVSPSQAVWCVCWL
jgi:hypothetical protein